MLSMFVFHPYPLTANGTHGNDLLSWALHASPFCGYNPRRQTRPKGRERGAER